MAGRGPLPPGEAVPGTGVFFWLNVAYQALPPIARLTLARQVRAWATKAEQDAQAEMQPTAENEFRAHGAYDTTGHTRP